MFPSPRAVAVAVVVPLVLLAGACQRTPSSASPAEPAVAAVEEPKGFCEKRFPQEGEGARPFVVPAEKPLPVPQLARAGNEDVRQASSAGAAPAASSTKGWRWVNLWATWCRPCTAEMPMLGRWRDALGKEGIDVALELWSVDEDEEALKAWLEGTQPPGVVRWFEDEDALGAALASFGVDVGSTLPVHVLVDAADRVRCVRTGAVHEDDYDAVKAVLSRG